MNADRTPYREERPWGSFEQFTHDEPSTVKIIRVNPGARLSLQRHAKRAEFWQVLDGAGTAEVDGTAIPLAPGVRVAIPLGATHRLSGGPDGLAVLEIATGEFDENDIERLEDDFGRIPPAS